MTATRDILALLALLGLVAAAVSVAAAWQASLRVDARPGLFLVLSPDTAEMQTLAIANGGHPVGPVSAPFATLVDGTAQTLAALRSGGAWMILPTAGLGVLCAPRTIGERP